MKKPRRFKTIATIVPRTVYADFERLAAIDGVSVSDLARRILLAVMRERLAQHAEATL